MVAELKGTGHVICEDIPLVLFVQRHVFSFTGHNYFKIHSEWFVYACTACKKE
jgi:hypothetical protein